MRQPRRCKSADLDACAGEQAPHNWCIMLPVSQRVHLASALSWLLAGIVMLSSSKLTLIRDFGAWPPVARDVYHAVTLFLHLRTAYPDLI